MEFDFKRDINKTIEMVERSIEKKEIIDPHYTKPFATTCVNHKDLFEQMGGKFNTYLGITGSMAPALNAIFYGAKDITCFDLSLPTFCYAYLQVASILGLEFEEYVAFILDHREKKSFSFELYQKIIDYLPTTNPMNVKKYFDVLYDYLGEETIRTHFFETLDEPLAQIFPVEMVLDFEQQRGTYFSQEGYEQVKKGLKNIKFKNLWMNMRDIPDALKGNTYDKIYLSCANHFLYKSSDFTILDVEDYLQLLNQFKTLLKEDGILQGALLYYFKDTGFDERDIYETMRYKEEGYQKILCDKQHMIDVAYVYQKS